LKIAFNTLDLNEDGYLSMEELKGGFTGYTMVATDNEWRDMI
jgi:Ca2+-binding EF-hand superfamily protein